MPLFLSLSLFHPNQLEKKYTETSGKEKYYILESITITEKSCPAILCRDYRGKHRNKYVEEKKMCAAEEKLILK